MTDVEIHNVKIRSLDPRLKTHPASFYVEMMSPELRADFDNMLWNYVPDTLFAHEVSFALWRTDRDAFLGMTKENIARRRVTWPSLVV